VEADHGFVEAVSDAGKAEPSLDVALEAHRLVDAAYRSAANGGAMIDLGPASDSMLPTTQG